MTVVTGKLHLIDDSRKGAYDFGCRNDVVKIADSNANL